MMHSRTVRLAMAWWMVLLSLVVAARAARADEPPPDHRVGVGYKIGNGLGYLGADVLVHPIDHITIDLQANFGSADTGDGTGRSANAYALAPALHLELRPTGSTPYLAVGLLYLHLSLDNVDASATGVFANVGWNWKWQSGPGIMVAAGVRHLPRIESTDSNATIDKQGQTAFNIEAGFHFMFL